MIWWISGIALIGFITIMAIMTTGSRDDDLFNRDEIEWFKQLGYEVEVNLYDRTFIVKH
ncbi:hypothetical protein AB1L07_02650 [Niallia alba]|uniref:hypothetical protein n=1 Tax=Niallia alba TaxID=2729105 RepID=UPI0039A07875